MRADLFLLRNLVMERLELHKIDLQNKSYLDGKWGDFKRIVTGISEIFPTQYASGKGKFKLNHFEKKWQAFIKKEEKLKDCIPDFESFERFLQQPNIYFINPPSRTIDLSYYDSYTVFVGCFGKGYFLNKYNDEIKEVLKGWIEEEKEEFGINETIKVHFSWSELFEGSKRYFEQRFEQLNITETLIPKWKQEGITTDVKLEGENQETSLLKGVEKLWKSKNKNSLIVGEGGMGKTYSLISIWRHFLTKKEPTQIIPIYISLNRYNDANDEEKKSYISNYILNNYLKKRVITKEIEIEFWNVIINDNEIEDFKPPKIILLLDGFNEITTDSIALRKDLDDWWFTKAKNVQTIITSRYDNRANNRWDKLKKIILQPLSRKAIETYLNKIKVDFPKEDELFELLSNPLMLTLYSSSNEGINKYGDSAEFDFKPTFTSQGELMWNFFESQLAKLFDTNLYDDSTYKYYSFLLKHLTSLIGFKMEEKGQYNILEKDLVTVVDSAGFIFYNKDFINTFPIYRGYLSQFNLTEKSFPENNQRFKIITDILCEKLQILSKEDYSYSFIHQNFRDFSASIYVINDLQIANQKKTISTTIQNRPLPMYIRKYVGEIEGEHKKKVELDKKKLWTINNDFENSISTQLTFLRGEYDEDIIGFSTWNIVEIYKDLRKELTGIDLSKLNLNKITFEGIRCFRRSQDNYLSTNFNDSLINENSFLQIEDTGEVSTIAHTGSVTAISYSNCGNYITSGGVDGKIKVWSSKIKKPIKTRSPHKLSVKFAHFLPTKKIVISGGFNVKISFIDSEYEAHTAHLPSRPTCMTISDDDDHILFGFDQEKLIEFYIPERKILQIYEGYQYKGYGEARILCISYSMDKKSFYSCSETGKIMVHQIGNYKGKLIRDSVDNEKVINAFICPSKNKIIAIFCDTEYYLYHIAEICLNTGKTLFNYEKSECTNSSKIIYNNEGNKFVITCFYKIFEYCCNIDQYENNYDADASIVSITYNSDDTKILVGCSDGQIIEWSTQNEKELYSSQIKRQSYVNPNATLSKNGDKLLTYLGGQQIYEWSIAKRKFIDMYSVNSSHIRCEIDYATDGESFIVVGNNDNGVEEFDTNTSEKIHQFYISLWNTFFLKYSLNGDEIFIGNLRDILYWDKTNKKEYQTNLKGEMVGINNLLIHPNKKNHFILSTKKDIVEKDLSGEVIKNFQGNFKDNINKIYIDSSKNELLALTDQNRILKWSLDSGQMISEDQEYYADSILDINTNHRIVFSKQYNQIQYWTKQKLEPDFVFNHIDSLLINHCTFYNLHPQSNLSEKAKSIMRQYGAGFEPV